MANLNRDAHERRERTDELTGHDASMDEASTGDAGNGGYPYGGDMMGGPPQDLEDEPSQADILPDQVRPFPEGVVPDAVDNPPEATAQPTERMPVDPSDFP